MESAYVCAREDQAVCAKLQKDHPDVGYALCYLYGVYRGRGYARDVALRLTLARLLRASNSLPA